MNMSKKLNPHGHPTTRPLNGLLTASLPNAVESNRRRRRQLSMRGWTGMWVVGQLGAVGGGGAVGR